MSSHFLPPRFLGITVSPKAKLGGGGEGLLAYAACFAFVPCHDVVREMRQLSFLFVYDTHDNVTTWTHGAKKLGFLVTMSC